LFYALSTADMSITTTSMESLSLAISWRRRKRRRRFIMCVHTWCSGHEWWQSVQLIKITWILLDCHWKAFIYLLFIYCCL